MNGNKVTMTTIINAIKVVIKEIAKISGYDFLCVSPQIISNLITAPLCGNVSIPPALIDAIL